MPGSVLARRALDLVAAASALLLAACATETVHVPYRPSAHGPADPPPAADFFTYERQPVPVTNHVEHEGGGHTVRLLAVPSVGENGQDGNRVVSRYYQRTSPGRKPLVIVLPIWGGSPYPSRIVTLDLLQEGRSHVLHVEGEQMVLDWSAMAEAASPEAFAMVVRHMVQRVRNTVIDLRRMIDWAEGRSEIDARRIGLIGFSESTWQVAGVMASDARLGAAVLVMGGAWPHEVIATCYGPPEEVRTSVMRRFGWSRGEVASALAPLMAPIDPDRLGSRVDPARVLVIDAQHDDCIPTGAREALWAAVGRPERISVAAGHAGSFLAMTFLGGNHLRKSIVEFFARALR